MKDFKRHTVTFAALATLATLQGCATSPSQLSADGKSDKIIFPLIEKNTWVNEGIFPNVDNLRNVSQGMSKSDIYALLGHPHFKEGIVNVREWDYVLKFHKNNGNEISTCQYKIIYTSSMRLQNTYWKPGTCAEWLDKPVTKAQAIVEHVVEKLVLSPELVRMKINADGIFDFDKSGIEHLRPGGVEKLNRVSTDLLSGGEIVRIIIVGYTDRLGNDLYNIKLSKDRADTIRQYLISKNIPAENITTSGAGKTMPLVECSQNQRGEDLIRCLEPNRRFEIEAWTVRKS